MHPGSLLPISTIRDKDIVFVSTVHVGMTLGVVPLSPAFPGSVQSVPKPPAFLVQHNCYGDCCRNPERGEGGGQNCSKVSAAAVQASRVYIPWRYVLLDDGICTASELFTRKGNTGRL